MNAFLAMLPLGLLLGGYSASAQAQNGEYSADAILAFACSGCHHNVNESIPSLKGWQAARIANALLAYREDEVEGTVMNRIAKGYNDEDIIAIARFLGEK